MSDTQEPRANINTMVVADSIYRRHENSGLAVSMACIIATPRMAKYNSAKGHKISMAEIQLTKSGTKTLILKYVCRGRHKTIVGDDPQLLVDTAIHDGIPSETININTLPIGYRE